MTLSIEPFDPSRPGFVGCVEGVDIARGVSPAQAEAIEAGMDTFAVLVFRDQMIDDEQQYAFSTHFGPMETATGDIAAREQRRLSMDINMLWHSDSSFKATPAKFSLLSGRVVPPEGGNTEFADMRAAWDALEPALKEECRPLVCEHSQLYSRALIGFADFTEAQREMWSPVRQRLVRRHPRTGRLSLYLSSHIGGIEGWPVPEARMFIRDLTEHATQREFVHAHRWQPWDLVMWDNRVVMHRARRYDHRAVRDLHRTTVADSGPTLEQPI